MGRHLMQASPRKLAKEKNISQSPERQKELQDEENGQSKIMRKISDQMLN